MFYRKRKETKLILRVKRISLNESLSIEDPGVTRRRKRSYERGKEEEGVTTCRLE